MSFHSIYSSNNQQSVARYFMKFKKYDEVIGNVQKLQCTITTMLHVTHFYTLMTTPHIENFVWSINEWRLPIQSFHFALRSSASST